MAKRPVILPADETPIDVTGEENPYPTEAEVRRALRKAKRQAQRRRLRVILWALDAKSE